MNSKLAEIDSLRDENREKQSMISELKTELRKKETEVKGLNHDLLEAQKEIRKLGEQKTELKGEVEKLEAVGAEVMKEKVRAEGEIEKHKRTIEDKTQDIVEWKKRTERLEYDLEAVKEKLNETTEGHRIRIKGELEREFGVKIIELEKALKLKGLDCDNLEEVIVKKEKEIQELRAKLKYKNTQLVEFNKFLMDTIKKTKKEQEEGEASKDEMIQLIKGKKPVDVEAERADDVATLINQNKAILKELVKFKTKYQLLKEDYDYMKENYEDSRSKKERMGNELIETKNMYNEFREQNMFYKREVEARTKENKILKDDLKFVENKLLAAEKENENLYTVIKGIRGGEYDSNDVLSKMKDKIDEKIEQNRQLTIALELRDKQVKELKKKLEEQKITMSGVIDMSQYQTNTNKDVDLGNMEENMVPLSQAMAIGRDERDLLKKKMEQLRGHNQDLKTLLGAKTEELEKKEKALKRAKEELDALRVRNKKGNEDNRIMDENLEELEKVLKKRNKEIESLENQVGILQQRSREMSDKIDLFEKENMKLRGGETEKANQLIQLESELKQKTQQLRELGVNV
jgi:chromosome segregation ATPase